MKSADQKVFDLKVADFGLAQHFSENQQLTEKWGTPTYIAPEILNEMPYNEKADIFSLGAIMYNLLTGKLLFPGSNSKQMLVNNKKCDLKPIL